MLIVSDIHLPNVNEDRYAAFLRAADDEASGDRLVVIPGDITENGRESDYGTATAFVEELQKRDIRIVLTPGNHDFGGTPLKRRMVQPECRDRYRELARKVEAWWRARPQEGLHVLSDDGFDSLTRVENHLFIALRSVHSWSSIQQPSNRVRREQIDWAEVQIGRHRKQDDVLHFVTHRSLWKQPSDKHEEMEKSKRLARDLLHPHGFRTFIHGHNHVAFDRIAELPGTETSIRHISVTTLSSRPPRECGGSGDVQAWTTLPLKDLAK